MSDRINWLKDLWFAGGSAPVASPELVMQQLRLGTAGAIGIVSASSVGIALSVAAVAVNFRFRELRFIKMCNPLLNNVIGAGCLMCYASCIVMAANSHWSVSAARCWAQAALLTLGYSAAFGAMLAKTWRVYRILTQTKTLIEECNCRDMNMWIGIELGIKSILLLSATFFAWETRNVRVEALYDSRQIGVCMYNATVMGLIGAVILFALPDWKLEMRVVLIASCIMVCATTTLVLVFGSTVQAVLALLRSNRIGSMAAANSAT